MSTPPPSASTSAHPPPTPEQVRQIERNRHLAKARVQQQAKGRGSLPSVEEVNANGKRLRVERDEEDPGGFEKGGKDSKGDGSGSGEMKKLKRDSRLGKYYDYNLSTLKDSKGGFLVLEEEEDPRRLRELQQIEELRLQRERAQEKAGLGKGGRLLDPVVPTDPTQRPKCTHCGAFDLDVQFQKVFDVRVCANCKNENPEKYSLLTKTECKDDYLLTDPELKDNEVLPHLLRPNPHRSTYSNMMLYLRCQVEEFAIKKWGSLEKLDEEYERREGVKKKKKNKKFEERLRELRKRTSRKGGEQERIEKQHKHEFREEGEGKRRCDCGVVVEEEVF
ncbi:DNA repair protein [Atractiella rhizophila]|nr:DNA repair protein [Atractiella rhizophila]